MTLSQEEAAAPDKGGGARSGRWIQAALALASLQVATLGFHPFDLPVFAWFGLVPWLAWHQARGPKGNALAAVLAFYAHFVAVLWWVNEITPAGTLLIPLLGLPFVAAAAWLVDRAVHRWRVAPALAWPLMIGATELLRDRFLGLSWSSLGYTQWRWLEGAQSAALFRIHGLTALVWAGNAALAALVVATLRRGAGPRRWRAPVLQLAGVGLAAVAMHLHGAARLEDPASPGPRIVGIQTDLPVHSTVPDRSASAFLQQVELLDEAGWPRPELLLTPETMWPAVGEGRGALQQVLDRRVSARVRYRDLLSRVGAAHSVLGYASYEVPSEDARDEDGDGHAEFNVAGVVAPDGRLLGRYRKRRLVPFGEFVPWPYGWPGRKWLDRTILETGGFLPDVTPGEGTLISELETPRGRWRYGMTICFEIVFPEDFRAYAREGVPLVANISNDAWYRTSSELDLVHVGARFRAIESGVAIARVSNGGISTLIDARGRYVATVTRQGERKSVSGVLEGEVPLHAERSPWGRHGDVLVLAWLLGLGVLAALTRSRVR